MKQASARAANVRICPQCGTRNRPKWDFCAKCGESLQDVAAGEPAPEEAPAAELPSDETGVPWASTLGTVVLIGAAIATYFYFREPPVPATPDIFTLATVPPSLPPAKGPLARTAGQDQYEKGRSRLWSNDPAGAARLLAEAVSLDPNNASYHHAYAVALWQSGARGGALTEYREAIRLDPGDVTSRMNYARALAETGQPADAIREFQMVAQLPNAPSDVLQELGRLYAKSGDYEKAADALRRASAAHPGDDVLRQELAGALEKAGRADEAAQLYDRILDKNPGADVTRGLLAEIYFTRGQKDEAITLFREGIARNAQAPLLHRGLGSLLERNGQTADAVAEYREYARLAPNSADARQLAERADRLERRLAASSPSPNS
jgi:Flp pilus assembly protein TadD/ribosomal protein L40E